MKSTTFTFLAVCLLTAFVTSCASTDSKSTAATPKFHESASTDVVLEFYTWKTIYLTKPDSHVNGFYPILTRETVAAEIQRHHTGHDLAVVILGQLIDSEQLASAIREWESVLGECGFHKVDFLRAGSGKKIDGLPIIKESVIAAAHAAPKTVAAIASVPSAP